MVSSRRILFPVDFSSYPFEVPPALGELIDRPHTEVILLHVMDARRSSGSKFVYGIQKLDALAQRHFSHSIVRRRLDNGSPATRILDYIRENDIDMLVLPARDSEGFGKGALGHVASEILAQAPCPVWLEWRPTARRKAARVDSLRICCAMDGAGPAERILRDAALFAEQLRGELTIVSSIQPQLTDSFALLEDPLVKERVVLRETERIDRLRRRLAPRADVTVAVGWREAVIGRMVRDMGADLLITGDCRQTILAAEATCPVLRVAPHAIGAHGFRGRVPVELPEYGRVA